MTVGEALTEARRLAGLSVDELSERARIRATVIRSIEQDDYTACGGDLYVRGYLRALAGAVGIDAQPLIREYDRLRASGESSGPAPAPAPAASAAQAPAPAAGPGPAPVGAAAAGAAPTAYDMPVITSATRGAAHAGATAMNATRADLTAVPMNPAAATAYDLPALREAPPTVQVQVPPAPVPPVPAPAPPGPVPGPAAGPASGAATRPASVAQTRIDLAAAPTDLMAAGFDLGQPVPGASVSVAQATVQAPAGREAATAVIPVPGAGQGGPGSGAPGAPGGPGRGKRRGLAVLAAVAVLAVAGVLGVRLASGSTSTRNTAASAAASTSSAAAEPSEQASTESSAPASATASQAATPKAHTVTLPVASVAAYGPAGLSDGDNPDLAKYAIAANPSRPWTSDWYVTPRFGLLKHGTGLLLGLGGKVTVTSIRLTLSSYQGSDVEIRVGNGTALADLRVAATTDDAAGTVTLTLRKPAAARYLLIWFIELPPDGAGHYEASVSHVVVTGQR